MDTLEFSIRPSRIFVYYLTIVYAITVFIIFFVKIPVFNFIEEYWKTYFYDFLERLFHPLLLKGVAIQYFHCFVELLVKSILILCIFFMYKKQIKLHGFRSHRNSIIHIRQNAVVKKNQGKQKEIKKTGRDKWMKRQYKITFKSGYSGLYTLLTNVYCNEWFIMLPFLKSKYLNIRSMSAFNVSRRENNHFTKENTRSNTPEEGIFPKHNSVQKEKNGSDKKDKYSSVEDDDGDIIAIMNSRKNIINNRKNFPKNAKFNNVNTSKKSIHKHINWVIIPRDSLSKQGFSHLKTVMYTQY